MYNKLKKVPKIFILLFFSFTILSLAQEDKSVKTLKVACIGNSITSGSKNKENVAYPAFLGKLLGEAYHVKNFGVSGRTLLRNGDYPYWKEKTYQDALEFNPDIVIIKLGTNDSKPQNWKYKDEFEKDYNDLVESFLNLPSNPKIFICKPVPAFKVMWGIRDSIIVNDIIPMIEKIGKEKNLEVIDLYRAFTGKENLFPDAIHPNEEGAALMAKEIYKAITKKVIE